MKNLKLILRCGLFAALSLAFSSSALADDETTSKWDVQPAVKKSIAPKNPSGIKGMVTATIDIDADGNITRAIINKSTDEALEEPVLAALKLWRFTPASLNGEAIACTIRVPFKFNG